VSFESAPFWRRLLARLLDLVFALALAFVLVIPVGLVMFPFLPLSTARSGPKSLLARAISWPTSRWSPSCWCVAGIKLSARA
jgi:uncharacterized RDD family membrane protein YckC